MRRRRFLRRRDPSCTLPTSPCRGRGGQGVARYVLDNPECVAGKRVLDVGSGCGVAALAAAAAGAAEVTANDVDPLASVAFRANARLCGLSGASSFHTEWSPYDRVRVVNDVS